MPAGDAPFHLTIVRYLEGQLSSSELVEFNSQLRTDAASRQAFVELCLIRAGLIEELKGRGEFAGTLDWWTDAQDDSAGPHDLGETMVVPVLSPLADEVADDSEIFPPTIVLPVQPENTRGRMRIWATAAIALLALTAGLIIWASSGRVTSSPIVSPVAVLSPQSKIIAANQPVTAPKSLGNLAMTVDAQWGAGTKLEIGSPLGPTPGQLTLLKGIAQFKLYNGTALVIQGPAQFTFQTETTIYLYQGKLSAELPHNGLAALTVITPDMRAVDLGTEFGVDVASQKRTHLEVFSGHVRAEVPQASGAPVARTLAANQAVVTLAGSNTLQSTIPTPLVFVRPAEMTALAQASLTPYDRWKSFSETLRLDPDMVAYYPFDNQAESPQKLINRALATAGQHDGIFGNGNARTQVPQWATGRWTAKGALLFGQNGSSAVAFQKPQSIVSSPAITLGAWIKRTELLHPVHFINGTIADRTRFNIDLLGNSDKLALRLKSRTAYFTWSDRDVPSTASLPADSQWCFLAITGTVNGETRFYVNGELVSSTSGNRSDAPSLEKLVLGAPVDSNKDADHSDLFRGVIDELMIFRRALSPEEILRVYKAGGAY
jgi:hypothetical protein